MEKQRIKRWPYFVVGFLMFVFYIFILIGSTVQHEAVHQAIYSAYDINSTVEYSFFDFSTDVLGTTAVLESEYQKKCNDTCKALHSQNEILSYNLDGLVFSLFSLFFLLITYLEVRR